MENRSEAFGIASYCVNKIEEERPDLLGMLHSVCWCQSCSANPDRSMHACCAEEEIGVAMRDILDCEPDEVTPVEIRLCISMLMFPMLRFV